MRMFQAGALRALILMSFAVACVACGRDTPGGAAAGSVQPRDIELKPLFPRDGVVSEGRLVRHWKDVSEDGRLRVRNARFAVLD